MNQVSQNQGNKPNWAVLAGLRFVLAMIVVGSHVEFFAPQFNVFAFMSQLTGFAAVAGFLIVSGYSIRHSISSHPQGYFERRVHRVYPVYLACLLLAVLPFFLGYVLIDSGHGARADAPDALTFIGCLFMLQGWVVEPVKTLTPAWTLGVECFFYLCAPILTRMRRDALVYLFFGSFLAYWVNHYMGRDYSNSADLLTVAGLFWFWIMGWLAYDGLKNEVERTAFLLMPPIALCALGGSGALAGLTVTLATLCILYQHKVTLSPHLKRWAIYGGEISYPLYLCHWPLFYIATAWNLPANGTLWIALSLVLSVLIYHTIDKPLRKNRKHPLRVETTVSEPAFASTQQG